MTKGLINACHKKNLLYKEQLDDSSELCKIRYKLYKNKLTSILKKAERMYYRNKMDKYKGNIKETWSVLNSMLGRNIRKSTLCDYIVKEGVKINNASAIANEFNDFYINVGPKLADKIDNSNVTGSFLDYLVDINSSDSMYVHPTSENEIANIVAKFSNKTSTDCYGMSMKLVKNIIGGIIKPITYICNLSMKFGVFPNELKVAKVIPIFKAGDIHDVSNYRPVSILPQLSKIIEKLFEKRLRQYINMHNYFFSGQYGFRTSHSTSLALNEMIDMIVNAIDSNKYSIGVFIDLKKAFDTVNHRLLIDKFKFYGIRGIASQFIKSYLSNRNQFVQYKEQKSNGNKILCGVP